MTYLSTTDFFEDKDFNDRWQRNLRGELDLAWMRAATEKVRCVPENPRRGLTLRDLDKGAYGFTDMPELARESRSLAPRGAELVAGLPDFQPTVSHKGEVWAHNTEGYYEEAMTRQWNATLDVAWHELDRYELPDEINRAFAQLLTFLTEVEMIATDVPAAWIGRLNNNFVEVKNFMATQVMDEARHAEVFRKRALTTGYGLMKASPQNEMSLKLIRDSDSFSEMSLALHLAGEGLVLTLFRFSEYVSPTEVDKKMFRLVMQDEARHVGYGVQHLKWVMQHFPEKREAIHRHLDEVENMIFGGGYAVEVTEPFIILAGKGLKKENIERGTAVTALFQLKQMEEYFERLDKCGLAERRQRSKLHRALELTRATLQERGILR